MTRTCTAVRSIALTLAFLLTLDGFAHAAHLPRQLAAMQIAVQPSSSAPIPPQIAAAHTVLLTNAGADSNFPVDADRVYSDFYHSLQAWNHFGLVSSPAQADLILSLRAVAPVTSVTGEGNDVSTVTSPAFKLTLIDSKTNVALWTITSPVPLPLLKRHQDKWYSLAVANLTSRLKVLVHQPLSATETAQLTEAPKSHVLLWSLIGAGALAGVGIGVGLALRNRYNNAVQQQQQAACASNPFFCTNP